MNLLVAKIGGSLAGDPRLAGWLEALAQWPGALAIVPGGGPFAQTVRHAQSRIGFNDLAAHRMALLAMAQFGIVLAALRPSPVICDRPEAFAQAFAQKRIALWNPESMAMAASDVPASWEATSDSLAAWLAQRLHASHLLLVKSLDPPSPASTAALAQRGLVDTLFAEFSARAGCPVFIAGPAHARAASTTLAMGSIPGVRVAALRGVERATS
ncbi:MAG: uridylate kinase [Hyphomicrobiales bacterium]|nr:uridylate kinase [Hyphomicrobiales bacterium]